MYDHYYACDCDHNLRKLSLLRMHNHRESSCSITGYRRDPGPVQDTNWQHAEASRQFKCHCLSHGASSKITAFRYSDERHELFMVEQSCVSKNACTDGTFRLPFETDANTTERVSRQWLQAFAAQHRLRQLQSQARQDTAGQKLPRRTVLG